LAPTNMWRPLICPKVAPTNVSQGVFFERRPLISAPTNLFYTCFLDENNAKLVGTVYWALPWDTPVGTTLGHSSGHHSEPKAKVVGTTCRGPGSHSLSICPRYPNLTSLWKLRHAPIGWQKQKQCGSGARIHIDFFCPQFE
jgi:hypothetical protein